MTRWKAFGIHLGISAAIGLAVAAVIGLVWYPPPLLRASGADYFLMVLIGVDVVLGPCLTLLVFKPGKPSLRFDLTVIAILQLSALAYGLWTAVHTRPVFLVGAVDRITLVRASDIAADDLTTARAAGSPFARLPWTGPVLVGNQLNDPERRKELTGIAISTGRSAEMRPQYFEPFEASADALFARARPWTELVEKHPEAEPRIRRLAEQHEQPLDDLVFLPLQTGKADLTVILSKSNQRWLGILEVDPW